MNLVHGKTFTSFWLAGIFAFVIFLGGCGKHTSPDFEYMPQMSYSPAFKPQEKGNSRLPVEGTIARGHDPYPYPSDPEAAGRDLKNPLPVNRATLQRGRHIFETFCVVCHGPYGEGDGFIVPKFPQPPSLQSDRIKAYPDGRIYHIITMGQGLMPSYAYQVESRDRWAVIHYVRLLHRAKSPSSADIKIYEDAD